MSLVELTEKYYNLIGGDHHKDKDCHFYINKTYSYGADPYYQFDHYGYYNTVESFFKDEENIKKYQAHFNQKKSVNDFMGELMPKLDLHISEFPKRLTEQEAEQDMQNFLEWAIKNEEEFKQNERD